MSVAAAEAGTPLLTVAACSICNHPEREQIERHLWLLVRGLPMDDGTIPTKAWLGRKGPALWGIPLPNPTIQAHLGQRMRNGRPNDPHWTDKSPGEAPLSMRDAKTAMAGREIPEVSATAFLERVVQIAAAKAELDPARVSVRDGLAAAQELRQRGADERQAELLRVLARATGQALAGAARPAVEAPIVDAEVVEEVGADA